MKAVAKPSGTPIMLPRKMIWPQSSGLGVPDKPIANSTKRPTPTSQPKTKPTTPLRMKPAAPQPKLVRIVTGIFDFSFDMELLSVTGVLQFRVEAMKLNPGYSLSLSNLLNV
jgi:hypothetical protein